MATKAYFEFKNAHDYFRALDALKGDARVYVMGAVNSAGEKLLGLTKAKLKPGKLRDSLYLKKNDTPAMLDNTLTWHDDVRAYAAPLELGHKLVAWGRETDKYVEPYQKSGYLRSTFDENEENLADMIVDGLNKALEGFGV